MSRQALSTLWWIGGLALVLTPYLTLWRSDWAAGLEPFTSWGLRWGTTALLLGLLAVLNPWSPTDRTREVTHRDA